MKIELKEIRIGDLVEDYKNEAESGVVGYSGLLDIRPKYQREFVYKIEQQQAVINTIINNFPLNVMYWVIKDNKKGYEVLDGQQRTISICEYITGNYSIIDIEGNPMYFHNLTDDKKKQILDYKLMVYFCEGADSEKLSWFKTINIAGEKLTDQELRNAVYTGPWLNDAKKYFSKTNCVAYNIGSDYVKGSPIRQELLEITLKWISNDKIEDYMSKHQNDEDADELWQHYQDIINWVKKLFPNYRKDMKNIDWGTLYTKYKNEKYNSAQLEKRYIELINDEELEGKDTKGIYLYLITNEEKYLNLRAFTDKQKLIVFEEQGRICPKCEKEFSIEQMEGDHIIPWSKGGKTTQENLQMLCKKCNGIKSNK